MKKTDLLNALGGVSGKYLAEASERARKSECSETDSENIVTGVEVMNKKNIWKKAVPAAAIAASLVIAAGTVLHINMGDFGGTAPANSSEKEAFSEKLTNYMTDTERNSISVSGITLIEKEKEEHTVAVELWSNKDYLTWAEENKELYSDEEYSDAVEFYQTSEFMSIHGVVIDNRYYTGFMPPYEYKGGEIAYTYSYSESTTTSTSDSSEPDATTVAKPQTENVEFSSFDEFKIWYRSYLDDGADKGRITQTEADNTYDDMLIIFESVMNETYETLDEPLEDYLKKGNYKNKWEFDTDELASISDSVSELSVYDEELDTSFIVHITLPPNYNESKSYPAFVMTDGVWRFGDHPMLWNMMKSNEVKDAILVSIGYDFQLDGTDNAVRARFFCEKKELFLNFITDNLMPYLNETYNIDFSQSALYGHSLGGVFSHYAAFNSDLYENQPFEYYIIGSPAFWSPYFLQNEDNPAAYQSEYGYFDRNKSFDKTLYICGGENEDQDYEEYYGENDTTLEGIENLIGRLEAHGVKSFKREIFENSNHYEYIPDMFIKFFMEYYKY